VVADLLPIKVLADRPMVEDPADLPTVEDLADLAEADAAAVVDFYSARISFTSRS
jgi:hypothetical protein